MNLVVFEQNKGQVKESLRTGTIDYLETVSEGAETDFFKYLNTRGILKQLAETYPLKRKKKEVPTWLLSPPTSVSGFTGCRASTAIRSPFGQAGC